MMNNELHLGDVLDSITPSDRVLVVNAANIDKDWEYHCK